MISPEFSRSAILYGGDAQKKIESATVAVCGVGAVGSFALEALARIGVGSFVLVDADTVDVSNINRQLCALHSTIGKSKTAVMRERVRDINPNARVEIVDRFIDESNCAEFVGLCPDVIVDAIDSLAPKAALAAAALSEGVPIVSSMGAARKTDPLKVAVAELFKTHSCPMAARMRKELRARGFKKGQPCVFSTEIPEAASHVKSGAADAKKIIGSTPIVTGTFGLVLANLALAQILNSKR